MQTTNEERRQYFKTTTEQINKELDSLQISYDSKLLATALAVRAGDLLRMLQAANAWTDKDISAVIQGAFADVHEPMDKKPHIVTLNPEQKLS